MLTSKNQEIKLTKDSKPFVIAEVGVNHNGKIEEAKKYIDLVKGLGADSIKFQLYKTENLVTKNAPKAEYQTRTTNEKSQFELLKKLELSFDEMYSIYEECKDVGLTFICTPFDKESLLFLMELNVPFIKLSSGDIDNVFFHE